MADAATTQATLKTPIAPPFVEMVVPALLRVWVFRARRVAPLALAEVGR